ncbi:MAG: hypothetical protein AAF728_11730, partial [Cyanobacteria bacterium P01_D01_bin.128]
GGWSLVSAAVGALFAPSQAIAAGDFSLSFENPDRADVGMASSDGSDSVAQMPAGEPLSADSQPLPVPSVPSFVALVAATEDSLPPPPPSMAPRDSEMAAIAPRSSVAVAPQSNPQDSPAAPDLNSLFEGGADSLVAKAIGIAEGTRTASGGYTAAYYGHIDPGNQAWNLGSFSYQHGADSPEAADAKQLQRLRAQAAQLRSQSAAQSISLNLKQTLNGLDLANQAPATALGRSGYISRLTQAQNLGLRGDEAILWARTRAFLNPNTQQWNAPGLGNNIEQITRDQSRRQQAIQKAIAAAQLSEDAIILPVANQAPADDTQGSGAIAAPSAPEVEADIQADLVDDMLSLDL